jgi:hypothetical protein
VSRDTQLVQGIVHGLDVEESWFDSLTDQEIFLFFIPSRLALRPTQPLSPRVKLPGREADHTSNLEPGLHGVHRDNFTLSLLFTPPSLKSNVHKQFTFTSATLKDSILSKRFRECQTVQFDLILPITIEK